MDSMYSGIIRRIKRLLVSLDEIKAKIEGEVLVLRQAVEIAAEKQDMEHLGIQGSQPASREQMTLLKTLGVDVACEGTLTRQDAYELIDHGLED